MSAQWCEKHWLDVRNLVTLGTHNGIVATLELTQAWMKRAIAEGRLNADMSNAEKNQVLYRNAPLCCFLGKDTLEKVLDASAVGNSPLCLIHLEPLDICPCKGMGA